MPDTDDFHDEWERFYERFTDAVDAEVDMGNNTREVARKVAYLPD